MFKVGNADQSAWEHVDSVHYQHHDDVDPRTIVFDLVEGGERTFDEDEVNGIVPVLGSGQQLLLDIVDGRRTGWIE